MKKLLLLIATIGLMVSGLAFAGGPDMQPPPPPPPPAANTGFYLGIHNGIAFLNVPGVKVGFGLGAQAGYQFTQNIRGEASFDYFYHGFTTAPLGIKGHFNSFLFMANALYDFHVTPMIDPFVGFGIGLNYVSAATGFGGVTLGTKFAYQAIAGVGFKIIRNTMFSIRYRFIGSSGLHYNVLETVFDYYFGNL